MRWRGIRRVMYDVLVSVHRGGPHLAHSEAMLMLRARTNPTTSLPRTASLTHTHTLSTFPDKVFPRFTQIELRHREPSSLSLSLSLSRARALSVALTPSLSLFRARAQQTLVRSFTHHLPTPSPQSPMAPASPPWPQPTDGTRRPLHRPNLGAVPKRRHCPLPTCGLVSVHDTRIRISCNTLRKLSCVGKGNSPSTDTPEATNPVR